MATNFRLLTIFIIYVIVELLFAKFYFNIYKSQPNTYHFDQTVIHQKISEVKKTHQSKLAQSGNVKYLEVFYETAKASNDDFQSNRFQTRLFFKDTLVFTLTYRGLGPQHSSYNIDVFDTNTAFITNFHISYDRDSPPLSDLIQIKINELKHEVDASLKILSKIKSNQPFPVWSYWDFVYFSNRKITGEIIPNNSSVRRLATLQDFMHVLILGFLINASFGVFKWLKNNKAKA